ncbi:deoxyguanosinetriphosphate triphosphohydrolase [Anaerosalibacter sp. Marseille-P3206]|uniref:deoxyguanosinetriphosphate triphosphohydrolase n=1 Tax=Anaerosalibacter sp. Marseille-P3206 TaxID=1871005 RepID=UPI0009878228|nr:deoxyguanosinetriphosphate triphosphohydrolase [Anaerosalibacter sp. Marseille-P3206]
MNIRLKTEEVENLILSEFATLSQNSKGRLIEEPNCNIRTVFQRDRDRIIHSKAFRRLKHKTQVFISPGGDHYRTRLTHTLEVSQISRTLARALRLNEDLTEAIALGHDLGHTPFGHTGENVLNSVHPNGFRHNEQSLRIVDFLEHNAKRIGLNLTHEVRDGILNHSGNNKPNTLEGLIVRKADRIAYINHDIDDSIRANIISPDEIPVDCVKVLGETHGERINTMILDIINNSMGKNSIYMSEEIEYYTMKLRDFMFEKVYLNRKAKKEEEKAEYIILELYKYYYKKPENLPLEHRMFYEERGFLKEDMVCDYIAGMTDRYAINLFYNIFIPKPWEKY